MTDKTYQTKVYVKQGGAELVVANGEKITVEAGGTIDTAAGMTIHGPGAVALSKIDAAGIKCLVAAGQNGAGAVALAGAAVGDRLIAVFGAPTTGGALEAKIPGTDFEAAVTVTDQIQQVSAANLSTKTYVFILIPAVA